jgi:hypothetical protein
MSEIEEAFPPAQLVALRAEAALAAAFGLDKARIYNLTDNRPPAGAPLPYIVLGDNQIIDDSDQCQDGSEIFARSHIYDNPDLVKGWKIAAVVRRVGRGALAIDGHDLVQAQFIDTVQQNDPNRGGHLIVTHRYLTVPLGA